MQSAAIRRIIGRELVSWFKDDASSMGAAIAFYTLFSIAPILLIVIWIASSFIAPEALQANVLKQIQLVLGDSGAAAVRAILMGAKNSVDHGYSTAISVVALLIGATSVFAELRNSLNRIWRTARPAGHQGVWLALRDRLLSFGLVLCVGFLLLVSLVISASLQAFSNWLGTVIANWQTVVFALDIIVGLVVTSLLFAMLYKYLPRDETAWGDVWVGALVTSTLFTIGKLIIVSYFGRIAIASAYGAAGSFLVLMLWVYYSAQIFLLGAEFTHSFACERDQRAPPMAFTSR